MELMTRCPACSAVFAASLEQLQLRKGYVRCPHCAQIFDGYEAVVPAGLPAVSASFTPVPVAPVTPVSAASVPLTPSYAEHPALPVADSAWLSSPAIEPTTPAIAPFRAVRRAAVEPAAAVPDVPPAWLQAQAPVRADSAFTDADEPFFATDHHAAYASDEPSFSDETSGVDQRDEDEEETSVLSGHAVYGEARGGSRSVVPDFLIDDEPAPRSGWMRVFWRVLVLAGVLLALGQAAYVYRMQLAVQWPWLRPVLEKACQPLKCTVPQARSMSNLSITDSSLQRQTEAAGSGGGQRMVFEAQLRNTLDAPQQWPVMWLELTDMSGAVVSRRYLTPDIYLAPQPVGTAFAAVSQQRIAVPLDIRAVHVSGYQVGLFFP